MWLRFQRIRSSSTRLVYMFFSHFFLNSFRKIGLYFLDLVDKFLFYAMFRMFLLQKLYTIYRFEVETGIFLAHSVVDTVSTMDVALSVCGARGRASLLVLRFDAFLVRRSLQKCVTRKSY